MPFSKILIAVDSSEYAVNAAKKGFELAQETNAAVALVFVVDAAKAIGNVDAGILPMEAEDMLRKEAQQTIDQLSDLSHDPSRLSKLMPEGNPQDEILQTADDWGADLIVMGTHGRTGLVHFLVGSIAESVVRHAKIPVMVVPTKE